MKENPSKLTFRQESDNKWEFNNSKYDEENLNLERQLQKMRLEENNSQNEELSISQINLKERI